MNYFLLLFEAVWKNSDWIELLYGTVRGTGTEQWLQAEWRNCIRNVVSCKEIQACEFTIPVFAAFINNFWTNWCGYHDTGGYRTFICYSFFSLWTCQVVTTGRPFSVGLCSFVWQEKPKFVILLIFFQCELRTCRRSEIFVWLSVWWL
jgi:hypothetical protein